MDEAVKPGATTRRIAVLHVVHLCALAGWLAGVVGAGIGAAVVFPVMKRLEPRLPGYEQFSDDHSVIAAGKVAQRVFLVADFVQFPMAFMSAGTLLALFIFGGLPRSRPSSLVRALGVGVAVAALASLLFIVTPRLNAASEAHWAAAQHGDRASVEVHRAAAREIHPIASGLMMTIAGGVLISLGAAAWSLARPVSNTRRVTTPSKYETPGLAGRRGL